MSIMVSNYVLILNLINILPASGVLDCSAFINSGSSTSDQQIQLKACFEANSYISKVISLEILRVAQIISIDHERNKLFGR